MPTRSLDKDPLNQGLLLSLPMFEGSGTASVLDVARPHHPVTQTGTPAWTQLSPSGLWVMDFDGTSDYLTATNAATTDLAFEGASPFTVSAWIYPDSVTGFYLMSRGVNSVSGWAAILSSTNSYLLLGVPGYFFVSSAAFGLQVNRWQLVGATKYSATLGGFYLDGMYQATSFAGSSVVTATASDLKISDTASSFNGKMWNPRIWGRALSSAEHKEIFDNERKLFGV